MVIPYSIYIHVPFCTKKCGYCHFYVTPYQKASISLYLEALKKEIDEKRKWIEVEGLVSIYFGGGTPSLLEPQEIATILSWLPNAKEITLEANPEKKIPFKEFKEAGVNRLSLGVQSLEDELLILLTRQHNAQSAEKAVIEAQEAGIHNISIDLMYDIPNQRIEHWQETLKRALLLPITHLSLYNLTIEPHTPFSQKKATFKLPDEKMSLQMLEEAISTLEKGGLMRYEISAFAKKGYESQHNLGYWTGRPFLGLGPSAYSYWEGKRFRNISSLSRYGKGERIDFEEKLNERTQKRELLAIGLRLIEGVRFTDSLDPSLQKLLSLDLLHFENDRLSLTPKGRLFYDSVAEEIIEDEI